MRYNFACALANHLHDKEAALGMLGPAFEKMGSGLINHAKIDPDLDPFAGRSALQRNAGSRRAAPVQIRLGSEGWGLN